MNRRDFLHNAALCVLLERPGQGAQTADSGDRFTIAASKGRQFLVSLFEPAIGLLPEYRDAGVFWLFHDNYLAAKILEKAAVQSGPRHVGRHGAEGPSDDENRNLGRQT